MSAFRRGLGLALLCAFLLGCAAAFRPPTPRWPAFLDSNFMHVGKFLQVAGTGRAKGRTYDKTQAKSLARDAALLDAWERLEGYILRLPLEDGGTVQEQVAASPALKAMLDQLVHSAEIASTRWEEDGTAAVVLRLDKGEINSLFKTGLPE